MHKRIAFTLAETLITLAIIGVVAAITMPPLVANYQKQVLVKQLKKSYSMWNQAFQKILVDEGVEKLSDTELFNSIPGSCVRGKDPACEEFIKGLQKYVKFELKRQKNEYISGGYKNSIDDYMFFLEDGSMIRLWGFYKNPEVRDCKAIKAAGGNMCSKITVAGSGYEFTIDVNGLKKPNMFGRDIFIFALSDEGVLYPFGGKDYALFLGNNSGYWKSAYSGSYSSGSCSNSFFHSTGNGCAGRIIENGWKMDY